MVTKVEWKLEPGRAGKNARETAELYGYTAVVHTTKSGNAHAQVLAALPPGRSGARDQMWCTPPGSDLDNAQAKQLALQRCALLAAQSEPTVILALQVLQEAARENDGANRVLQNALNEAKVAHFNHGKASEAYDRALAAAQLKLEAAELLPDVEDDGVAPLL